ncbi:MAG: M1 family metallopeptidase [Candidatus Pacebacteria bacterium]|nr:M1 family metallopeptidase [Candidatus Paceibacterota bacterium]MCF7862876.1 M1 family metallopeptidase [Candidatus Paceibacterota bacterium]
MNKNKTKIRLSKNIIPLRYNIEVKPDLENFTFSGKEVIFVNILENTDTITLHTKDIQIDVANVSVSSKKDDQKIFAKKITYNQKQETATFFFSKKIPAGKIFLTLIFKGILNDKMRGFYRSKYHIEGATEHMATTQFEATDARRAFPCFDEPAQKSIFEVSLIVPKGHTAISNTLPVSVLEHEAGYEIVRFSPTPKMSTYLLAFIVGKFEFLEKKSKNGVLVRVYTTPGKTYQAKFALECTVKTLDFYEEYFDIPYPLPTLNMIAIPDFSSLAMENWGAITFREIGLLVDEKNTSIQSKEKVAEVIAHEIAHQWFGNLVTMEWWTHLWLNEGFASYIPYLAIHKIFPKWNIWERFVTDTSGIALRLDSLKNTHPIEIEVHHPDEIGEIFDAVSYSKGASVIAMLADYLGKEHFRNGLRYYLKKHSYKNTETIHLWQAFEKISKKPVAKVMQNWTSKGGYPVIEARIEGENIILKQDRFFSSPISKQKNKEKVLWQIPVSFGDNKQKQKLSLSDKETSFKYTKEWVKINLGENGFFRVVYSNELLQKLKNPIIKKELPSYDRLGIIRDLFASAEAGIIPTSLVLDFLDAYKNEDSYIVWVEIGRGLSQLEQIFAKTKEISKIEKITIGLFYPLIKKLGWDPKSKEPNTDSLLRSMVLHRLARSKEPNTLKKAKSLWKAILKGEQIHPDIRSAIYSAVAVEGDLSDFNKMIEMYKKESMHEEKNRLGSSLGDFNQKDILQKVCQFALSEDVRTQDSPSIIGSVGMNPVGRDIWWNFTQKNWDLLINRYGEGSHQLSRIIKSSSGSAEEKHLSSLKKFFETHKAPGAERAVEQVFEKIESNIAWKKRGL